MGKLSRKMQKRMSLPAVQRANPRLAASILREQADQADAYAKAARTKADKLDPPTAPAVADVSVDEVLEG